MKFRITYSAAPGEPIEVDSTPSAEVAVEAKYGKAFPQLAAEGTLDALYFAAYQSTEGGREDRRGHAYAAWLDTVVEIDVVKSATQVASYLVALPPEVQAVILADFTDDERAEVEALLAKGAAARESDDDPFPPAPPTGS